MGPSVLRTSGHWGRSCRRPQGGGAGQATAALGPCRLRRSGGLQADPSSRGLSSLAVRGSRLCAAALPTWALFLQPVLKMRFCPRGSGVPCFETLRVLAGRAGHLPCHPATQPPHPSPRAQRSKVSSNRKAFVRHLHSLKQGTVAAVGTKSQAVSGRLNVATTVSPHNFQAVFLSRWAEKSQEEVSSSSLQQPPNDGKDERGLSLLS